MRWCPSTLTKDGGQQRNPDYVAVNPQMRVPALALSSGDVLTQSLAIIEYLDDIQPEPPLLPADALQRAKVRAIAQIVACDIHPLNNLIALQYLKTHPQARAAGDRRLVPPLGDRGLQGDRGDDLRPRPTPAARMSRSPTSVWCRKCSTRGGSRCRSTHSRKSSRPTPPVSSSRPSTRRGRRTSPMPSDGGPRAC